MLRYWLYFVCFIAITTGLDYRAGRSLHANETSELHVAVTIRPLHSLVSGVMEGVGKPDLIIRSGVSPHTYQLKPSDAKALERADIVFWIGPHFEYFLVKPISSMGKRAELVTLTDIRRLRLYKNRLRPFWSDDKNDHPTHNRRHHFTSVKNELLKSDMHIWLDPLNAKQMIGEIVKRVSAADPQNSTRYQMNGRKVEQRLEQLKTDLETGLDHVRDRPLVVFHDAYQYFEKRFKLTKVDTVLVSPDRRPGADTIRLLRRRIAKLRPLCAFAEPQFDPRILRVLLEGSQIQISTLDPLGADLVPGPDLYFDMMRNNGKSLVDCLSRAS